MPQEICIVQCYKCCMYQTQIVKKSKKWSCTVCGEKQSMKKSYGQGSGKECRELVQKLNSLRKNAEEALEVDFDEDGNDLATTHQHEQLKESYCTAICSNSEVTAFPKESKWAKYLDNSQEPTSDED